MRLCSDFGQWLSRRAALESAHVGLAGLDARAEIFRQSDHVIVESGITPALTGASYFQKEFECFVD